MFNALTLVESPGEKNRFGEVKCDTLEFRDFTTGGFLAPVKGDADTAETIETKDCKTHVRDIIGCFKDHRRFQLLQ